MVIMKNLVVNIDKETAKKIINAQVPFIIVGGLAGLSISLYFGLKDLRSALYPYIIISTLFLCIIGFFWLYKIMVKKLINTTIELDRNKNVLIESHNGKTKIVELNNDFKIENSRLGTTVGNNLNKILISKELKEYENILEIIKVYHQH